MDDDGCTEGEVVGRGFVAGGDENGGVWLGGGEEGGDLGRDQIINH